MSKIAVLLKFLVVFSIKTKTQIVKWNARYNIYNTVKSWNDTYIHTLNGCLPFVTGWKVPNFQYIQIQNYLLKWWTWRNNFLQEFKYGKITHCVKSSGTGKSNIPDSLLFTQTNNFSLLLQSAIVEFLYFILFIYFFFAEQILSPLTTRSTT
jgi:hypothetical protein